MRLKRRLGFRTWSWLRSPEARDTREGAPSDSDPLHLLRTSVELTARSLCTPGTGIHSGVRSSQEQMSTSGTFAAASASFHWVAFSAGAPDVASRSRLSADHKVVAGDCHLEASGESHSFALLSFFVLCSVVGVPLSWHKTSGGDTVFWVGFELLHWTHHLGISERRCSAKWARETASSAFFPHGMVRGQVGENYERRGCVGTL